MRRGKLEGTLLKRCNAAELPSLVKGPRGPLDPLGAQRVLQGMLKRCLHAA